MILTNLNKNRPETATFRVQEFKNTMLRPCGSVLVERPGRIGARVWILTHVVHLNSCMFPRIFATWIQWVLKGIGKLLVFLL